MMTEAPIAAGMLAALFAYAAAERSAERRRLDWRSFGRWVKANQEALNDMAEAMGMIGRAGISAAEANQRFTEGLRRLNAPPRK